MKLIFGTRYKITLLPHTVDLLVTILLTVTNFFPENENVGKALPDLNGVTTQIKQRIFTVGKTFNALYDFLSLLCRRK
jgi:hypothetical protein